MSAKSTQVIYEMYKRFTWECKRFSTNQAEMASLEAHYFRYRELLHEQERIRSEIVALFGLLGVHAPAVSEEFAKSISSEPIDSAEIRKTLKVWQMFDMYLSALQDKCSVAQFKQFLFALGVQVSPQAIESAVKAHPELFQESTTEAGEKLLSLRVASS